MLKTFLIYYDEDNYYVTKSFIFLNYGIVSN
ncbi:hypothetical protein CLV55_101466 [Flavobacterium aciduliphilum]|uniref:Uncharacterized protein n=1 Tax=Flavobacterium aciduliphilum TaxID=1101402 RepID=A0A328YNX6_9FLAO|nr:hypothetical protein CLV55_101466 [Flavobacterium aciduliphilum]